MLFSCVLINISMSLFKKLFNFITSSEDVYEVSVETLSTIWCKSKPQEFSQAVQPVEVSNNQTPQELSYSIYDALEDVIKPYMKTIEAQGLWDEMMSFFAFVEKYGSYPSVVLTDDTIEYSDAILDILKNVTLKDHSIRVTRLFIQILSESYKDISGLVATAIIAGLGHDIGKAEPLRGSIQYSKYDHPLISLDVTKSMFTAGPAVNKALDIIVSHHKQSQDAMIGLFQQADTEARVQELKDANVNVESVKSVLSYGDILAAIEPHINSPKSDTEWHVFTFKGVVYVDPEFLYETVVKLANSRGVVLDSMVRYISRPLLLKEVIKILREYGVIPAQLQYDYFQWYEIKTDHASRKMRLIPMKIEAFEKTSGELEERKFTQSRSGMLKFLKSVTVSSYKRSTK